MRKGKRQNSLCDKPTGTLGKYIPQKETIYDKADKQYKEWLNTQKPKAK